MMKLGVKLLPIKVGKGSVHLLIALYQKTVNKALERLLNMAFLVMKVPYYVAYFCLINCFLIRQLANERIL